MLGELGLKQLLLDQLGLCQLRLDHQGRGQGGRGQNRTAEMARPRRGRWPDGQDGGQGEGVPGPESAETWAAGCVDHE